MSNPLELIRVKDAINELSITRHVFEHRVLSLEIKPIKRGHYKKHDIDRIRKYKPKQRLKSNYKIEIIKVTETYHIYESKINYL